MKLRQAAFYLNYSPSQLRILVQQGQIPYLPGKGRVHEGLGASHRTVKHAFLLGVSGAP